MSVPVVRNGPGYALYRNADGSQHLLRFPSPTLRDEFLRLFPDRASRIPPPDADLPGLWRLPRIGTTHAEKTLHRLNGAIFIKGEIHAAG